VRGGVQHRVEPVNPVPPQVEQPVELERRRDDPGDQVAQRCGERTAEHPHGRAAHRSCQGSPSALAEVARSTVTRLASPAIALPGAATAGLPGKKSSPAPARTS
jgi:hypothetical protein